MTTPPPDRNGPSKTSSGDRSGRRRRQQDALKPAESPAQDRRAQHAGPCARVCAPGWRRIRWPSWSGRIVPTSMPKFSARRPMPMFSSRPSGGARPMRCWPLARSFAQDFDDVLGGFRRYAAGAAENFCAAARKEIGRRRRRGAGFRTCRSHRLWPSVDGLRRAIAGDPRTQGRERFGARGRPVQRRPYGSRWRQGVGMAGAHRRRQCPKGVLSARRGRGRAARRRLLRHRHDGGGRGAGRQRQGATSGSGSGNPAAPAVRRHAGGRNPDRAGNGVFQL